VLKASERSGVAPFMAMDVLAAAARLEAAGRRIIHMEVGQPGAPAPAAVLAAAAEALRGGRLVYTEACGIAPLRERIAHHYRERYGLDVAAERVIVTTGSSGGFTIAFLGAFDPGDRILLASPGYPAYRNILAALGLRAVELEVGPDTRWALTADQVAEVHRTTPLAGVLVASPANPTGTMTEAEELRRLVGCCDERGIRFVSDEIYHGLVYAGRAETALGLGEHAIVVNSFSKYYCMTGWRVGWLVVPAELVRPFERLAQSLYISAPDLSQRAAIAAFDAAAELDAVKEGYAANRRDLLARLPKLGFDEILPVDGAFYAYASAARLAADSGAFARRMLEEAGVAATPGLDFDRGRGHRYIRFSFAGSGAEVLEGLDRLERWLG
jgi:aspartate/methionine/tyrosine aminotransferase